MVSKGERDLAEERIATKSKAYESDASTFSNRLPLKNITVPYFFSKDILSSRHETSLSMRFLPRAPQ